MVVRLDGGQNQIGSGIVVLTAYPVEKNNQQTGKGQQVNEYGVSGSAGREGAALQIGGSLGDFLAQTFHFDEKDKKLMIMCGMSACFSAVFGTPMAAAVFSMEVISVGIMHYSALVPCVFHL